MCSFEPGLPPKYVGRSCCRRAIADHASHSRAAVFALRLVLTKAPSILASIKAKTSGRRYASRVVREHPAAVVEADGDLALRLPRAERPFAWLVTAPAAAARGRGRRVRRR